MIKFFRKIRQNLIMENKTSKYFKYAIGEIILVVIGILIALQINTWNQNRIDKNVEDEVIAHLHRDFIENKKTLDEFVVANQEEMNALTTLMSLVGATNEELQEQNLDSLFYESLAANELAFADNTLKNIMQSDQLNLLKNEDVNALLYQWNELSEIRVIRMSKLDDWANNHFIPYLLSRISFKEMDAISKLKWTGKSKVKPDYYPMFQEVEFENYLDNSLWFHQQIDVRCKEMQALIEKIIKVTKL